MTTQTFAAGAARWAQLKRNAAALGVPYADLLRVVGEVLGRHQLAEALTDEQIAWVERRLAEMARGGVGGPDEG